ncbi:MAG: T9SS type A sorting domain-containing protein, partial [Bacteroidales bacterium]|nr:T9SS type A sorting domain-containing protein [Bacteroidales bacterium]
TIGKNSNFVNGSYGNVGLEFRCNTFNSNAYSLSIIDGNMRKYQGEYQASQGSDYAGNAFDHVGTNLERDFYVDQIVVSSLNIPLYLYYSHTDDPHNIQYCTWAKVSEEGEAAWFQETDCSSTSGGGGGIILGMSIGAGTDIIEQTDTEIMLKEFELEEATDNGNTNVLLSQAETMNSNNSVAVAEEISGLDGFISDEVAITYMQNNNGNQFAKANALLENSPLPLSVRDEIDNMNMNPTLKHIVKNQQNGVNNRDKKQAEIAELKQFRGLVVNDMVYFAINNDSVPEELQELEQFLLNDNNLQSKMHLVNLYRSKNENANAHATLNGIKLMLRDMDIENYSEIEDYIDLQNIIIDVEAQSLSIEDAIESNSEMLVYIAQSESHPGQVAAQLLLAEAGVEDYYELIRLPEPLITEKNAKTENIKSESAPNYQDIINVYPNPTKGEVYIEYAFLSSDAGKFIEIYGINGVLIERIDLIQSAGLFTYNKPLSPGNYIVKVGKNYSQQITVQ